MTKFFTLPKNPERVGLIGHVICDYPDKSLCQKTLKIMKKYGVALSELQVPCSEPIADGPLFMKANHEALKKGFRVQDTFDWLTVEPSMPKVIMTYANIIFKFGTEKFVEASAQKGCKGFIVPDLPVELAGDFLKVCKKHGVVWIPIVTPNMTDSRMTEVLEAGGGFVYAVARAGVTGKTTALNHDISSYLEKIRSKTDLPIGVGFGISKKSDLELLNGMADYAIVGSAAMRALLEGGEQSLEDFWQAMSS